MAKGISGIGLAAASGGVLFLWSALKGASVQDTLRELIEGKEPSGQNKFPIDVPEGSIPNGGNGIGTATGDAAKILEIAGSMKGRCYVFGGGHGSNPCASRCLDCSGYVSCVLNKAGVMKGSMTTLGFARIGKSVSWEERRPGDIIVWNGGTGGGHMGIILDGKRMWESPCTGCGGVRIGPYPRGSRTQSSAVIRRVT